MKKLLFTRMKGICTKKSTDVKDEENALMESKCGTELYTVHINGR